MLRVWGYLAIRGIKRFYCHHFRKHAGDWATIINRSRQPYLGSCGWCGKLAEFDPYDRVVIYF